jgi:dihydrofolate synthase/folylpolyglutamate synthase
MKTIDLPYKCIHIAGTNGKGSTAAYIGSILRAAGLKCGVYTSPHVVRPSERIAVDGEDIPEAALESLLKKYGSAPTIFHAYTYAAFEWFARQNADFAVIETGLGGRKDPTSEVAPVLCVFTPIGMDHMQYLGDTLGKIAYEKCGILKPGVKALSAPQRGEAAAVIKAEAAVLGSPLYLLQPEDLRIVQRELSEQRFDFSYKGKTLTDLEIQMPGLRQPENAAAAAAACLECGIGEEAVRRGLKTARLQARFEVIPGEPTVILDGAHNADSARELKETLGFYFPGKPAVLLAAVMADKDVDAVMDAFAGFAAEAVTVKAEETRGCDAQTLASVLVKRGVPAETAEDIESAYKKAVEKAVKRKALLVASGSFYLAGRLKGAGLIG